MLVVTSISLQYNSTVTACPVRFLQVCNPVRKQRSQYAQLIWTLSTVLTPLIHSICKTGCNTTTEKKVRIMDRYNIITVPQTVRNTLGWIITMCMETYYGRNLKIWNRTLLSSNLHFIFSYGWLMKCQQYTTATSSTYKINVSNSKFVILFYIHRTPSRDTKTNYQLYMTRQTLKNPVWNSYVAKKSVTVRGCGGMTGVTNIYTHTQFKHQQSITWRRLKYINTQNPPKCTSITWYEWSWPSMKLHQCTVEKTFEIP